jgi:hypothetical protein
MINLFPLSLLDLIMIIKPPKINSYLFKKTRIVFTNLPHKKWIFGTLTIPLFFFVSLMLIDYGVNIQFHAQGGPIRDMIIDASVTRFDVFKNIINGAKVEPKQVKIDIAFKNLQKIAYYRKLSLSRGGIREDVKKEQIPAKLIYQGKSYKVKLQMTGQNLDHVGDSEKWSLRVKVKGEKTIFGMKEFSLLNPHSRGKLSEWVYHQMEKEEGLISLNFDFVDVTINGKHIGIYTLEEHFRKHVIERNKHREGIIFKPVFPLKIFNSKKVQNNSLLNEQRLLLLKTWGAFNNGEIEADKLFDYDKMAKFYAIVDLFGGHHATISDNMRFYFNPITNLIEPIGRELGELRYSHSNSTTKLTYSSPPYPKLFEDQAFLKMYFKHLERITKKEYLESFFKKIEPDKEYRMNILFRDYPFYAYPKEYLFRNQNIIRKILDPSKGLLISYAGRTKTIVKLNIQNVDGLPIKIKDIFWKSHRKNSIGEVSEYPELAVLRKEQK